MRNTSILLLWRSEHYCLSFNFANNLKDNKHLFQSENLHSLELSSTNNDYHHQVNLQQKK